MIPVPWTNRLLGLRWPYGDVAPVCNRSTLLAAFAHCCKLVVSYINFDVQLGIFFEKLIESIIASYNFGIAFSHDR